MSFRETLKDIARAPFQWKELKFKNEAAAYAKANGVSNVEAQKAIFDARLRLVSHEVVLNKSIDYDSKEFANVQAALYELVGSAQMDRFKQHADNPAVFRALAPALRSAELTSAQKYYRDKFKGDAPATAVITDTAEKTKLITELITRFSGDPRLVGAADLRSTLIANPDLSADIGKMLQAKEELERHERMFGREVNFERSMATLKTNAWETVTSKMWTPIGGYLKKFNIPTSGKKFVDHFVAMAKAIGQELKVGTELLIDISDVVSKGLRNNRVFEAATEAPKKFLKKVIKP